MICLSSGFLPPPWPPISVSVLFISAPPDESYRRRCSCSSPPYASLGKAAIQFPRASNNSARTQVPDYIEESQLYTAIPKTFSLNNQRKRSYSLAEPLANPTSGPSASSQPHPHRTKTAGQKKHPRQPVPQQQHVCSSLGCSCALAQGKKSSSYSTLPSYSTDTSAPNVQPAASSSDGFPVHSARHAHRRKSTTNASPSPPMPRSHSSSDIESPWQCVSPLCALPSVLACFAHALSPSFNLQEG